MNVSFHPQARKIYKFCFELCKDCILRVKGGQKMCDTCVALEDECPARAVMAMIDSQYAAKGDLYKLHGEKNIRSGAVRVTINEPVIEDEEEANG